MLEESFKQGTISERFTLLEKQIDCGDVTDPSALNTYFELAPLYEAELAKEVDANRVELGFSSNPHLLQNGEMAAIRDGGEVARVEYCLDVANSALTLAQSSPRLSSEFAHKRAAFQRRKAVNWLRIAAAYIELSSAAKHLDVSEDATES